MFVPSNGKCSNAEISNSETSKKGHVVELDFHYRSKMQGLQFLSFQIHVANCNEIGQQPIKKVLTNTSQLEPMVPDDAIIWFVHFMKDNVDKSLKSNCIKSWQTYQSGCSHTMKVNYQSTTSKDAASPRALRFFMREFCSYLLTEPFEVINKKLVGFFSVHNIANHKDQITRINISESLTHLI